MIEKFLNIFRIPDLRKRVLFTLGILAVYRLGAWIPTPGVNYHQLEQLFNTQGGSALAAYAGGIREAAESVHATTAGLVYCVEASICGTINGQPLARIPDLRFSVTPSDLQTFSWGTLSEFMTYEHVGQHYQDGTGLNPLGTYYDIGAGIVATIGANWQLRLLGSNLTNQLGLTEGNARFGGNAVQNSVGFGRSIVGREGSIQLKYKF